ncbi:MAG: TIGR04255 family protein [Phycisphaerae bacterium]|nr:TIGR04255 family protein [Phycisphaerae bacterium]
MIETVLGVQFERISGLQNGHLGAFWRTLGGSWPHVRDMPPIDRVVERFGEDETWASLGSQLKLTQDPSARLQIRSEAGDRMIQVQNGRLHYNWLGKVGGPYPRYTSIRPEFDDVLNRFVRFLADENLGELKADHWEITYVNHLPKGTVWDTIDQWGDVLVGLPGAWQSPEGLRFEGLQGEWHFEIEPQRGRLHVQVNRARSGQGVDDILRLALTARGGVAPSGREGLTLDEGLNLGRETIVRAFRSMTSEKARSYWGPANDDS